MLEGEFEKDRVRAAGADQSAEPKRSDHAELLSVCGPLSAFVFLRVHLWFNGVVSGSTGTSGLEPCVIRQFLRAR